MSRSVTQPARSNPSSTMPSRVLRKVRPPKSRSTWEKRQRDRIPSRRRSIVSGFERGLRTSRRVPIIASAPAKPNKRAA